jgi:hypothetical protein
MAKMEANRLDRPWRLLQSVFLISFEREGKGGLVDYHPSSERCGVPPRRLSILYERAGSPFLSFSTMGNPSV